MPRWSPVLVGAVVAAAGVSAAAGYVGLVTAAFPVDLGIGRRHRRLDPLAVTIHAPPRHSVRDSRRAVPGPPDPCPCREDPGLGARHRHGPRGTPHADRRLRDLGNLRAAAQMSRHGIWPILHGTARYKRAVRLIDT